MKSHAHSVRKGKEERKRKKKKEIRREGGREKTEVELLSEGEVVMTE